MSSRAHGASLTETLMPAAVAAAATVAGAARSEVKVTMPERWRAPVVDLHAVDGTESRPQALAQAGDPFGDGVDAEVQGVVDGHAQPEVGGDRDLEFGEAFGPGSQPVVAGVLPQRPRSSRCPEAGAVRRTRP